MNLTAYLAPIRENRELDEIREDSILEYLFGSVVTATQVLLSEIEGNPNKLTEAQHTLTWIRIHLGMRISIYLEFPNFKKARIVRNGTAMSLSDVIRDWIEKDLPMPIVPPDEARILGVPAERIAEAENAYNTIIEKEEEE